MQNCNNISAPITDNLGQQVTDQIVANNEPNSNTLSAEEAEELERDNNFDHENPENKVDLENSGAHQEFV